MISIDKKLKFKLWESHIYIYTNPPTTIVLSEQQKHLFLHEERGVCFRYGCQRWMGSDEQDASHTHEFQSRYLSRYLRLRFLFAGSFPKWRCPTPPHDPWFPSSPSLFLSVLLTSPSNDYSPSKAKRKLNKEFTR